MISAAEPTIRVLNGDGRPDPALDPRLEAGELFSLYRTMVVARRLRERFDEHADLGFVPAPLNGEAVAIGAVKALASDDWIFSTPGDFAFALARGLSPEALCHRVFANADDPLGGRASAGDLSVRSLSLVSTSAPAATHLPHAVGTAWAARQGGSSQITLAVFDAVEIDAADFHTGLNFAGVLKTPTVFLCRTRPGHPHASEHAIAYGLDASKCDGTDLLAVVRCVRGAIEEVRGGGQAVIVDAIVDPEADCLRRAERYLTANHRFDASDEWSADVDAEIAGAIASAAARPAPPPRAIFDHVYGERSSVLEEQYEQLMADRKSD